MNFSQRSTEKELLDRDDIPFEDIRRNMEELDFINTYLGGHQITRMGLRYLLAAKPADKTMPLVICEIGCGGGDNMLALARWCSQKNITTRFIGIDINPECIAVATVKLAALDVHLITSDYLAADIQNDRPDIIFSSLFCHHFSNEALVVMLQWMHRFAKSGCFINDLHRHPLAYYAIRMLSRLFSRSYLVKNDAPLSVLRGFTKYEWHFLFQQAGIEHYHIRWKWAFRHLITVNQAT